jgi:predicted RNase H-like HicB family nuclease
MPKTVKHKRAVRIHITRLPEGVYLATSDDVQGLVAQGGTVAETLEIARDVVGKLPDGKIKTGYRSPRLAHPEDAPAFKMEIDDETDSTNS